jgi:uncharacterized coiled-coil protein SlyX
MKFFIFLIFLTTKLTSSVDIHCIFSVTAWSDLGTVYTCHATVTRFTGGTTVTSVTGSHLPGRSNDDVVAIDFTREIIDSDCSTLTFIPQGLTGFFANFRAFLAAYCNIQAFTGFELDEYPDIELLSVVRGEFQRIPARLFQSTPKLRSINFGANNIQYIGGGAFDHLDALVTLRFWNSGCVNRQVFNNRTLVLGLIEEIKVNCTSIDDPETSTISSCLGAGNHDERICQLEDTVAKHEVINEDHSDMLRVHENEIAKLRKDVEYLTEKLLEMSTWPCSCRN